MPGKARRTTEGPHFLDRADSEVPQPGCMSCWILQEAKVPYAFCYEARWKTQEDLLRHIRSKHYKRLLVLMDLGDEPPLVEFHGVVETRGFDLIERARNALRA